MNIQRIRRTQSDELPTKSGPTQLDIIQQLKAQVDYLKQAVTWMAHVNAGNLLLLDMTSTNPFKVPFERGRMLTIASVSLCMLEGPQPSHGKDPSFLDMFPDLYFPTESMVKERAYHELRRRKDLVEEMQKAGPIESLKKWRKVNDLLENPAPDQNPAEETVNDPLQAPILDESVFSEVSPPLILPTPPPVRLRLDRVWEDRVWDR